MTSKYRPGTLPDHAYCNTHRGHLLGCRQYERLLARSGQRCEICLTPGSECTRGKLCIDHYGYDWAVRGLLCDRCNTMLSGKVAERGAAWAAEYLANSWWIAECEQLGLSTRIAPEPERGAVITDQFEVKRLRGSDGLWRPWGRGRPGINSASWRWIYEHRGPHNMAPVDLYGADRGGPWDYLIEESERAALAALLAEHAPAGAVRPVRRRHRGLLGAYLANSSRPGVTVYGRREVESWGHADSPAS